MKDFTFQNPVKIHFGHDKLSLLGDELKHFGKRVLLTYGGGSIKKIGLYDRVQQAVKDAGMELYELSGIEPNPRIDSVRKGAEMCKEHNIDVLLAVGGGSTIDCTKWIAAAACVEHDAWDFFDYDKWSPVEKALPIVSILTLSATGSEMDSGGVISNPETDDKRGRQSKLLFPKVSFLDPTLTYSVSPFQTAAGSADIFSHLMEVYFAPGETMYMLDTFIEGMMRTVIRYAPIAIREPENYEARANLMWTSSWAINGLVGADKPQAWSCHPMEHELSAVYDITHGLGLAILSPRWLEYCMNKDTMPKIAQFGINVFGIEPTMPQREIALRAIDALGHFLFDTLGLKRTLPECGIDESHFESMAAKAVLPYEGKLPGFCTLTKDDVVNIYRMCMK
ncbi:MAG: iron-containing alcohol dehydrogenase [Bacteroidales bacterium]|nr:iron-containing alcohol dehydrogenase [Bacteroidales bacterium]